MKLSSTSCALIAFGLVILGCGGGGSTVSGPINPISGTINTTNFSIPAGQTRTVVDDLTVLASDSITIEGTLLVKDGATVSMLADNDLIIDGTITNWEDGTAAAPSRVSDLVNQIYCATNVQIRQAREIGPNTRFNVTPAVQNGTVTISGPITAKPGRDGRGFSGTGESGTNIEIGTEVAVQAAKDAGFAGASAPATVSVSAEIKAGDGGAGNDDTRGSFQGKNVSLDGQPGGVGGSIGISATQVVFAGAAKLTPGAGGQGGWAGRAKNAGSGVVRSLPGTAELEKGGRVSGGAGSGGSAGTATVTGAVTGNSNIQPALGGLAGHVFVVAGDGGSGGAGGDVNITAQAPGNNSDGTPRTQTITISVTAGNGGDSRTQNFPGGAGGSARIALVSNPPSLQIFVAGGNGGLGFNGCSVTPPTQGTGGGNAGKIDTSGRAYTLASQSFNGGDGGDYIDVGQVTPGGDRGSDDRGSLVGVDGWDGITCSIAHKVITLISDWKLNGETVVAAGQTISMRRVRGVLVVEGHGVNCDHEHVHAPGGFSFDKGPLIPDPDPNGCGLGHTN